MPVGWEGLVGAWVSRCLDIGGSFSGVEGAIVDVGGCGFGQESREKSLGRVEEVSGGRAVGLINGVGVAGCLVDGHRAKMLKWARGIDALVGVFGGDHIVEPVRGVGPERAGLGDAGA